MPKCAASNEAASSRKAPQRPLAATDADPPGACSPRGAPQRPGGTEVTRSRPAVSRSQNSSGVSAPGRRQAIAMTAVADAPPPETAVADAPPSDAGGSA